MQNIYIASPFFNSWDNMVRLKMIKETKRKFPREQLFRPNATWCSFLYRFFHSKFLAKRIYNENLRHLTNAAILVFPKYTTDLGTLFEIGLAISKGIAVYRYDYFTNKLEILNTNMEELISLCDKVKDSNGLVLDCSKPPLAITMGCLVGKSIKGFKYSLPNAWADNIMFKFSGISREVKDGESINRAVL